MAVYKNPQALKFVDISLLKDKQFQNDVLRKVNAEQCLTILKDELEKNPDLIKSLQRNKQIKDLMDSKPHATGTNNSANKKDAANPAIF
jgi:hypothetical protein